MIIGGRVWRASIFKKKNDFEKQIVEVNIVQLMSETLLRQGQCSGSLHHFLPYQDFGRTQNVSFMFSC